MPSPSQNSANPSSSGLGWLRCYPQGSGRYADWSSALVCIYCFLQLRAACTPNSPYFLAHPSILIRPHQKHNITFIPNSSIAGQSISGASRWRARPRERGGIIVLVVEAPGSAPGSGLSSVIPQQVCLYNSIIYRYVNCLFAMFKKSTVGKCNEFTCNSDRAAI